MRLSLTACCSQRHVAQGGRGRGTPRHLLSREGGCSSPQQTLTPSGKPASGGGGTQQSKGHPIRPSSSSGLIVPPPISLPGHNLHVDRDPFPAVAGPGSSSSVAG